MKYCPTSTLVRNPASVQNLLNLSCCDSFSIRSPYLCNSNSLCRIIIVKKRVCVDHIWHERKTRLFSHDGSSRVIGFIFFTHFCDCTVKTELICRSSCAKYSCNRFEVGTTVDRQFFHRLCFIAFLWTMDSWHGRPDVCFRQISNIIFSAILSHSPSGLSALIEYHFLWSSPRNDHCPAPNLLANRETSWAFDSHSSCCVLISIKMSLNIDTKIIRPVKFSGVSPNLNSNSWTL